MREFSKRYRNPVETIIDKLWSVSESQSATFGKLAYSEVMAWLVAYYKSMVKKLSDVQIYQYAYVWMKNNCL